MTQRQRYERQDRAREFAAPECEHCGQRLIAITAREFRSRAPEVPGAVFLVHGVDTLASVVGEDHPLTFCGECGCFAAVDMPIHGAHS